jgi:hypothetical protein
MDAVDSAFERALAFPAIAFTENEDKIMKRILVIPALLLLAASLAAQTTAAPVSAALRACAKITSHSRWSQCVVPRR